MQSLWKTVWSFLNKLKIELPYATLLPYAIPFLSIYPDKTIFRKDTCTSMFIAALFTIAKTRKQPKSLSTNEWIKKICHTHTHTHIEWGKYIYTHTHSVVYIYIHTQKGLLLSYSKE